MGPPWREGQYCCTLLPVYTVYHDRAGVQEVYPGRVHREHGYPGYTPRYPCSVSLVPDSACRLILDQFSDEDRVRVEVQVPVSAPGLNLDQSYILVDRELILGLVMASTSSRSLSPLT